MPSKTLLLSDGTNEIKVFCSESFRLVKHESKKFGGPIEVYKAKKKIPFLFFLSLFFFALIQYIHYIMEGHTTGTPTNESEPDYLRMILTSRVYEIVNETPLQEALNLNSKLGSNIYLKREDLQPVFSFKIRGAYNRLAHLTQEEKNRGVIACSAGKVKG
jgi:hypothetical protein